MNLVPGKLYKLIANRTLWKEENGSEKIAYLNAGSIVMFLEDSPINKDNTYLIPSHLVLFQDKVGFIYNNPIISILEEIKT